VEGSSQKEPGFGRSVGFPEDFPQDLDCPAVIPFFPGRRGKGKLLRTLTAFFYNLLQNAAVMWGCSKPGWF
jgi:hypothetical protein